jgi:hypothetical protein
MTTPVRLALLAATMLAGTSAAAAPFRFVALPDTQVYSENRFPDGRFPPVTDPAGTGHIFGDQTQWVVDNAAAKNIRYVGHLGDIVQNGDNPALAPAEWALAKAAMDKLLDADIPHGTVMGNHDDQHGPNYMADYLTNFGPQNYAGRDWYTAASPSGGANFVQLEQDGRKVGFLNFSIDQPQDEIDWANGIIKANPDTIFVVGTHRYLYDYKLFAGRYGETNVTPLGTFTLTEGRQLEPGFNTGQELFDEIVAANPNVLMIHAGHFHSEYLQVTGTTDTRGQVIEILTDYQDARNGGDGWLRLYTLDFDAGTLGWETYSPTLDRQRSTLDHFVETIQQTYTASGAVMQLLGIPDYASYLAWLDANLKDNPLIPNGFLTQHPDWDAAYYNQYLSDMFNGSIPDGFDDIHEWENLWMLAFAADIMNPLDFSDGLRSPSGLLRVDYDAYRATPVPLPMTAPLLAAGLAALLVAARRRAA